MGSGTTFSHGHGSPLGAGTTRPTIPGGSPWRASASLLSLLCSPRASRSPCSPPVAAMTAAAARRRDDHTRRADGSGEVTASGISPERCEANKAAGTITYLSGFDFSASASIVEVIVAEDKGYFDDMCLDVELKPSFSVGQLPLVAANEAQFASAGSYAEIADFNAANDADLVVVAWRARPPSTASSSRTARAPTLGRSRGQDHRREGQAATVAQGDAGPGRARRGHRLHDGRHRGLRPAGPHRAARTRRLHRLQVQRARPAGAGRRALHAARPVEGRHPRDRSASSTRTPGSSTSIRRRRRTSCGPPCGAWRTPSPTRTRRRRPPST